MASSLTAETASSYLLVVKVCAGRLILLRLQCICMGFQDWFEEQEYKPEDMQLHLVAKEGSFPL